MAVARIHPEPKRGVHSELKNSTGDFDKAYISRSRAVLRHARELSDSVLSGAKSLDEAYKVAQTRKCAAESDDATLNTLKSDAPDHASDLIRESVRSHTQSGEGV